MIKMDYFAEEWKNSATKICRFKFLFYICRNNYKSVEYERNKTNRF